MFSRLTPAPDAATATVCDPAVGEATPLVRSSPDDAPIHKWTAPERIMLVVAGGEAGRFSAVLGPCDGMGTRPVTKEIRWTT